jgi:glucose-6-phosphate isomerase
LKIDLTPQAGFDLFLEPSTLDVATPGEVHFIQETRRVRDLRTVLFEPDALSEDTVLYWNYKLDRAGEAGPFFQRLGLTFGLVLLPPLQVGREYVKTHGHYHSMMPGSTIISRKYIALF